MIKSTNRESGTPVFGLKIPTVHSMHKNSYPGLSFFLLDSSQGGLLGNAEPAAEFPLKEKEESCDILITPTDSQSTVNISKSPWLLYNITAVRMSLVPYKFYFMAPRFRHCT